MNVNIFWQVIFIILTPLLGSAAIYFVFRKAGIAMNGTLAIVSCLVMLALSCLLAIYPAAGKSVNIIVPWISFLGINVSLYYDGISSLALIASFAVALLALIYSTGYFRGAEGFDASAFYSLALLFLAGLAGVLLSANLVLFYLFWELMLLPTFCLTAYFGEDRQRSAAIALKYFIFTHVGAVLMLVAFLVIYSITGSTDMLALKALLLKGDMVFLAAAGLLLITGLSVKMAIFPFHSWLPETYANAPMPATVLMSAVMMNAPMYAFLRFFHTVLPKQAVAPFILLMLALALVSQFYGALLAMSEKNIKRLVAYSSVSQMGYVLFGIATMTFLGASGSAFHMVNHSIIKALLFMSVGAVFFATGTYSIGKLGGLTAKLPLTALAGAAGGLAIAGVPLFGAFQSEWLIFAGGLGSAYPLLGGLAVAGVVFTAAYALKYIAEVFFGDRQAQVGREVPFTVIAPMMALSAAALVIGVYPWFFSGFVQIAIRMLGV